MLQGGLADNHFAAQLDQVVRNPGSYPVYGNSDQFFTLTYPTQGLKDLLARTFGRLTGAKIEGAQHGVIRHRVVERAVTEREVPRAAAPGYPPNTNTA